MDGMGWDGTGLNAWIMRHSPEIAKDWVAWQRVLGTGKGFEGTGSRALVRVNGAWRGMVCPA